MEIKTMVLSDKVRAIKATGVECHDLSYITTKRIGRLILIEPPALDRKEVSDEVKKFIIQYLIDNANELYNTSNLLLIETDVEDKNLPLWTSLGFEVVFHYQGVRKNYFKVVRDLITKRVRYS